MLLLTLLGIIGLGAGVFCMFLFVTSIDAGGSVVLLLASLVTIGAAVYCFLIAGKSDALVVTKENITPPTVAPTQAQGTLDKQNELASKWNKTMDNRDKMKMLNIAAKASE